jgi:hypothetical protein
MVMALISTILLHECFVEIYSFVWEVDLGMKRWKIVVGSIILISLLLYFSPYIIVRFAMTYPGFHNPAGRINELKKRIPEVRTYCKDNAESLDTLKNFFFEDDDLMFIIYKRESNKVRVSRGTKEIKIVLISECEYFTQEIRDAINNLLGGIDDTGSIYISNNSASIVYAQLPKDGRVFLNINSGIKTLSSGDIDSSFETVDTNEGYVELTKENWYIEITSWPMD